MSVLEQRVETRPWKVTQGLIENGRCQVCHGYNETVKHPVAGCTVLSNSKCLTRHNRVLIILAVIWVKEYKFIRTYTVQYKERWERGMVLEGNKAKLV